MKGKLNIKNPEKRTILELIKNYNFHIPDYQRPYRWTKKQFKELIEDLELSIENDNEHFFGSIILTKSDVGEKYIDVVDGQQRLTTIIFILQLINRKLMNSKSNEFMVKDGCKLLEINISEDRGIFENLLSKEKSLDELRKKTKNDSYRSAIEYFDKYLSDLNEPTLKLLEEAILTKLIIIEIKTDTLGIAYTLFEVLNNRGLELSVEDLLKNHFLREIGEDKIRKKEFLDLWQTLSNSLSEKDSNIAEFLRIYFIGLTGKNPRKNLYDEIKNFAEIKNKSAINFIRDLKEKWVELLDILDYNKCKNKEIRKKLLLMPYLNNQYWKSVIVACIEHNYELNEIYGLINNLERFNALYWISGHTAQKVRDPQLSMILKINKYPKEKAIDYLNYFIKRKEVDEELYLSFERNVKRNCYSPRWSKYVLAKLELELDDSSYVKRIDLYDKHIQIEHIMPQNIKKHWNNIPKSEHEQHLNNIGNLTLLSGGKGGKNQKISNKSFQEKKKYYGGMNRESENELVDKKVAFRMIDDVIKEDNWSIDVINNRTNRMLQTLKKSWQMNEEFDLIEKNLWNIKDELDYISGESEIYKKKVIFVFKKIIDSEKPLSRENLKEQITQEFNDPHFLNGFSQVITKSADLELMKSLNFEGTYGEGNKKGPKTNYSIKKEYKSLIQQLIDFENEVKN